MPARHDDPDAARTGITGLDDILAGGFARHRLYLAEGVPGSGKTTLALQFLIAGAAAGECVLYVTLSETEEELRAVAASHGWTLDGITIIELTPSEAELAPEHQNTMFHPAEVELAATTTRVLDEVDRLKPSRIVIDSLSELRLLAGNALRYRRQILALKQSFTKRNCTVVLLDDLTSSDRDLQMQSIVHGVISLEQLSPEYAAERRRLRVVKYRGVAYRGGLHDYVIRRGGLEVFPRLVAAEHRQVTSGEVLQSSIPQLDELLGGGIDAGTSTLLVGAPGTGKTTLAAHFVATAAARGIRAALFLFDENPQTLIRRCRSLGVGLPEALESGLVTMQQIDPAELSPGEFTNAIRIVVAAGAKLIVIDSLNGYLNSMPEERYLTIQLHEVLTYLGQLGVATIMIGAQQGVIGTQMQMPVDASYLADNVILLRYYETKGEVRQALSVMKKRGGRHERTIRELRFDSDGLHVGQPLREFRGVLTGVPIYEGTGPKVA